MNSRKKIHWSDIRWYERVWERESTLYENDRCNQKIKSYRSIVPKVSAQRTLILEIENGFETKQSAEIVCKRNCLSLWALSTHELLHFECAERKQVEKGNFNQIYEKYISSRLAHKFLCSVQHWGANRWQPYRGTGRSSTTSSLLVLHLASSLFHNLFNEIQNLLAWWSSLLSMSKVLFSAIDGRNEEREKQNHLFNFIKSQLNSDRIVE